MSPTPAICCAVEGPTDIAVAGRLLRESGLELHADYGRYEGKQGLLRRIRGFNQAARFSPWLVLVDLDQDFDCAPSARAEWLPRPAVAMSFCIAVRAVEAWLLADAEAASELLAVPAQRLPASPDALSDPKATLVALASGSRNHLVRARLVPEPGSGRRVGREYAGALQEFAAGPWRPHVAAERSPSLARCLLALQRLSAEGPARAGL